ncbi:DUF397 domain-containing protein [Streptomyces sp. MZ04]|uniref:DUF397 domain-containing protein n=1 Tax=Streptomyces sp. MZ04 TaxID=2559236 RepID=UPI00107EACEE|nr:DUF397 domain-containing protein [Streptomyces sp. MZ04]TGB05717.1 DUF397 domain-containing protein [Streptomyces sp. MZ04]
MTTHSAPAKLPELTWQKSTFSDGAGANCVYVATTATGTIHLRESDTPETTLTTTPRALSALIRTLTTAT